MDFFKLFNLLLNNKLYVWENLVYVIINNLLKEI